MFKRLIIINIGLLFLLSCTASNVKVHRVNDGNTHNDKEGIYYQLPKTVLAIDITLQKVDLKPGEFYAWADAYPELNLEGVIKEKKTTFKVINPTISAKRIADPDQIFFVELEANNLQKRNITMTLSEDSILSKASSLVQDQTFEFTVKLLEIGAGIFGKAIALTEVEKEDVILTNEQVIAFEKKKHRTKAKDDRDTIIKIRKIKRDLILSPKVNYEGESLKVKLAELDKLENKLLVKFTGMKAETEQTLKFEITPESDKLEYRLFIFTTEAIPATYRIKNDGNFLKLKKLVPPGVISKLEKIENKAPANEDLFVKYLEINGIDKKFYKDIKKYTLGSAARHGIMVDEDKVKKKELALPKGFYYEIEIIKDKVELDDKERLVRLKLDLDKKQLAKIVKNQKSDTVIRGWYYRIPAEAVAKIEQIKAELEDPSDSNSDTVLFVEKELLSTPTRIAQAGIIQSLPSTLGTARSTYNLTLFENTGGIQVITVSSDPVSASSLDSIAKAQESIFEGLEARKKAKEAERAKKDKLFRLERQRKILEEEKKIQDLEKDLNKN